MTLARPPVGLLPAAGRGSRFGASGYAKELFPLLFDSAPDLEPRPICELALRAIRSAGAERCVVVISREKADLIRVLGGGETVLLSLAYTVQSVPSGLPDAVRAAEPWIAGEGVVFAMPDTVVLPDDALAQVHAERLRTHSDLVLGVFPVDEPERLGPVAVRAGGKVARVFDKPKRPRLRNSWGVAAWGPRFTDLCLEWAKREAIASAREPSLGEVFQAAVSGGLVVRAVPFANGTFLDVGTPKGLRSALLALSSRGMLVPAQSSAVRVKRGR